MKALLLSAILLITISPLFAQITLDQNDLMIPGQLLNEYVDTTTKTLDFGNAGSGQTWDYSTLTEDTVWNADILLPAGQLYASSFPTATAAIERFEINTQYYENTASASTFLGSVVVLPTIDTVIFHQNYKYIEFPASLNSQVSDVGDGYFSYKFQAGIDPDGAGPHPFVDSIATKTTNAFDGVIDASGTIQTPIHQYQALRQYSKSTTIDSALMHANGQWQPMSALLSSFLMTPLVQTDTTYTYAWMVKGGGLPILVAEFEPDNNDEILIIQWTDYLPQGIDHTERITGLRYYPNPVKDVLNIESLEHENLMYQIYGQDGKLILEGSILEKASVNLSDLASGTYILHVNNQEGKRDSRRIIVE